MLLTTSPATVNRGRGPICAARGLFILTRGSKHDMGPGQSHNTIILDLYFKDYSLSDIERQTNHSETSGRPYLSDFIQIASLHRQGFTPTQIRRITQKSDRLVREYLEFYTTCDRQDNERLHQQQLMPQSSGEAAKKRRLAPVPGRPFP